MTISLLKVKPPVLAGGHFDKFSPDQEQKPFAIKLYQIR